MRTQIPKTVQPARNGQLKTIHYSDDRPFEQWTDQELMKEINDCLNEEPIKLEFISLADTEFRNRQADTVAVRALLNSYDVKIIRWLNGLRYRIKNLVADFDPDLGRGRRHKVYFILLCLAGRSGPPHPWGLYVGQTSRTLEVRLSQHLDPSHDYRSRKVARRGWDLLYSVCEYVPPMKKKDALRFENLVLNSLKGEGREGTLRSLSPSRVKGG